MTALWSRTRRDQSVDSSQQATKSLDDLEESPDECSALSGATKGGNVHIKLDSDSTRPQIDMQ